MHSALAGTLIQLSGLCPKELHSVELLLKGPQCLFMCFQNHILDCRGLADHTLKQERMDRWRWPQSMQMSRRSWPYLIPCHGPECFISWHVRKGLVDDTKVHLTVYIPIDGRYTLDP